MEHSPHSGQRVALVDLVRALAVALMVIFHTTYDLKLFGAVDLDFQNGFWWGLPRFIVFLFLWAVGVSLCLVHLPHPRWKVFWKRFGVLAGMALVVSVGTYVLFPERWIYFGTLHCIALCSLLGMPFLKYPWIALAVGLPMLVLAAFFQINIPWILLPHWSLDYIPPFPWLGVVLLGIFCFHRGWYRDPEILAAFAKTRVGRAALWSGKHSLGIYMLHQPLIYGVMYAWFNLVSKH